MILFRQHINKPLQRQKFCIESGA